jgi:DUF1365 family protein
MESCLYVGRVRHRRLAPIENRFSYTVAQLYLDLGELDTVFRGRWLWSTRRPAWARFRRADYLGDPRQPLDRAVRDLVESQTGHRPAGPIRLLTHPRYLGFAMNPVSFYYAFDAAGSALEAIVAEVRNTPWGERHPYVLDARAAERCGALRRFRFRKAFHVSPFMSMDVDYDWRFGAPGPELLVHMQNRSAGHFFFDATLQLERRAISTSSLALALARHPLMTWKVWSAIYLQALRLWWKRCPSFAHPGSREPRSP